MPLDVEKYLNNNIDKYELYEKQEAFINLWLTACVFFNSIIFMMILDLTGIVYIGVQNWKIALNLLLFVIILEKFFNAFYQLVKNIVVNFVSIPLLLINQHANLLLHLVIDVFVCLFANSIISFYLLSILNIQTSMCVFSVMICSTCLTGSIFLLGRASRDAVKIAQDDKIYRVYFNYNCIFTNSLFLSNLISFFIAAFKILSGLTSTILFFLIQIIPPLAYIIFEMCRKDPDENLEYDTKK